MSSKKFRWSIISITTLKYYFCDYMLTYTHKIKGRPKLTDGWELKLRIKFSFSFYNCILLIKYPKTHSSKSHSRTWKGRAWAKFMEKHLLRIYDLRSRNIPCARNTDTVLNMLHSCRIGKEKEDRQLSNTEVLRKVQSSKPRALRTVTYRIA